MGLSVDTTTKRTMRCDNPKCDFEISWIEEQVKDNEDAVPREFFRFLFVGRSYVDPDKRGKDPGQYTFCSGLCARKWLEAIYKPSTPPLLSSELEKACDEAMKDLEKKTEPPTFEAAAPEPNESDQPCEDTMPVTELPPENIVQMPSVEVAPLVPDQGVSIPVTVVEKSNVLEFPVRKTDEPVDASPAETEPV